MIAARIQSFPAPTRHRVVRPVVHQLPDDELISEVQRRHGGIHAEVLADAGLRALIVGYLRADYQVLETYRWRPGPPLPVPVTAFAGRDGDVRSDDLAAWQQHTTEPMTVQRFPGGHFYLREHPVPVLRSIAAVLD